MARLTQADLRQLNETFEERSPQELIRWAAEMFGDRLAALSSMQRGGSALCQMLSTLDVKIPVLFVDTGVLFQETYDTRDRIIEKYGLEVRTLMPKWSMEKQTQEHGVLYLSVEGQQQCCHMRKSEPLLAVSDQFDAMISSLRRSDGGNRSQLPILALDPQTNCIRINPLSTFSAEQLSEYIRENGVIVNPLHAQGYATIGCNRCTTPVMENEPGRAGRWRHLGPWSQYCGINPTDMMSPDKLSIDLPLDLVDRILGRETDFVI
ncbi:phosphoadenylyl-sulfate reductase [Stratiformator vulcanicus]|uniref:Adenosine 5'-phosphosulfate reductase n=1 Tax=Stratiformator vulcanicus TaxID=2527980 RepID=A0A517QW49_9PLAN|nr:phosphoadenylyl-sulfate reductase [Stratiformator vulcanicus]QDT35889.1 Phosphoadenosine phosphosulfate reductase [Stratiformator vulcanicus]